MRPTQSEEGERFYIHHLVLRKNRRAGTGKMRKADCQNRSGTREKLKTDQSAAWPNFAGGMTADRVYLAQRPRWRARFLLDGQGDEEGRALGHCGGEVKALNLDVRMRVVPGALEEAQRPVVFADH
jgi:hypothetical protein